MSAVNSIFKTEFNIRYEFSLNICIMSWGVLFTKKDTKNSKPDGFLSLEPAHDMIMLYFFRGCVIHRLRHRFQFQLSWREKRIVAQIIIKPNGILQFMNQFMTETKLKNWICVNANSFEWILWGNNPRRTNKAPFSRLWQVPTSSHWP